MSRERFRASAELAVPAAAQGMPRITTPFGTEWLPTRHEDGNSTTFSTAGLVRLQRQQAGVGDDVPDQDSSAVPAQKVEFRGFTPVHGIRSLPVAW
jgi:hypothetical protein